MSKRPLFLGAFLIVGALAACWVGAIILAVAGLIGAAVCLLLALVDRVYERAPKLWVSVLFAAVLLFAIPAAAETLTGSQATDTDSLVVMAVAGLVAFVRWLFKRELAQAVTLIGLQLTPQHQSQIDAAIDAAAADIQAKLSAFVEDEIKTHVGSAMAGDHAQAIIRYLPTAAAALGLTPESVTARINAALGDPLSTPIPPLPTSAGAPVPVPQAPGAPS